MPITPSLPHIQPSPEPPVIEPPVEEPPEEGGAVSFFTVYPIAFRFETRGYSTQGWNGKTARDFKNVELPVATWNPSIYVTQLTDSANDERALNVNAITRDRTKYDRFGKADFDPTNVNGDFNDPGRQDYSVDLSDELAVDLENVDVEQAQRGVLRFSTRSRGRYVSYRIEESQGYVAVEGCRMESRGVRAARRWG